MTRKLLLMLLLLCFQTQTLAGAAPCCIQDSETADVVADTCHHPKAAQSHGSDTPKKRCGHCSDCQLGCNFGVTALPLERTLTTAPEHGTVVSRIPLDHFYRFVPDPLQRPPISSLA